MRYGITGSGFLGVGREFRAGCDSGARNDGLIRSFFVRFQIIDDLNSMSPKAGVFSPLPSRCPGLAAVAGDR
jgi:hypothetical protein